MIQCICSAHQDCRAGALSGCGMCAKAEIEHLERDIAHLLERLSEEVKAPLLDALTEKIRKLTAHTFQFGTTKVDGRWLKREEVMRCLSEPTPEKPTHLPIDPELGPKEEA